MIRIGPSEQDRRMPEGSTTALMLAVGIHNAYGVSAVPKAALERQT
jgi:hypothetical protein